MVRSFVKIFLILLLKKGEVMIKKVKISVGMLVVSVSMLSTPLLATPTAEMLSYTCAGCHGTNGVSAGPGIPSIAGLSQDYLIEAMQDYRDDERNPTIMNRIAKGYSDKEFELMGQFFSSQKIQAVKGQSYDVSKAKQGKVLHEEYCSKCHTEGGAVTDDEAGILSGNTRYFLQYSLADFKNGLRDAPKKMKKQFKKMLKKDPDAFNKLLDYYSSAN